ncbi:MAG: murein hydrolase activator EnvC family protein [Bacillota bacterium]
MWRLKPQTIFLSLGLVSFLVLGSAGWCVSEEEIQRQIEQTKKKISQNKLRENKVLSSLLKTQEELEKIGDNLERLNLNLGQTNQRIKIITGQLNNAQFQLEQIKTQIGGRKGVLDQRLVAIYKYGYQSYLEVLFSSRNFTDFAVRFEMIGQYVRDDLRILKALQQQQEIITEKREEIARRQKELQLEKKIFSRLQMETTAEQNRKLSLMKDKKAELSVLQNNRKVLEASLDELERISKEMEAQIRNLQSKNRPALGSGKFIWPVSGRVTSYFGLRYHPILRKKKYHSGIDIASPLGTPIQAADAGVVIFSGWNGGYGKMIIIDHGNGISSVYAHCSVLIAGDGKTVSKGEKIGNVGSTGLSTGPHLHFEIRKNGVPVDPLGSL